MDCLNMELDADDNNVATLDVGERARRYLAQHGISSTRKGNGGNLLENKKDENVHDSMYTTINHMRIQAMNQPNLNGKAGTHSISVGSFYNSGDSRMSSVMLRTSFSSKLNVSFSFDPVEHVCLSCPSKHRIFEGKGGAGVDVFVLADQNFPPIVKTAKGNCLKIIRVENGTLTELANTFIDVASAASLGVGSVVLLTSATMLADVGIAAYAEELVRVSRILLGCFGGKILVRQVPPLLLNGTSDSALIRAIFELGSWLGSCSDKQEGFPENSMGEVLLSLKNSGVGGLQSNYRSRMKLPVSTTSYDKKTWESSGWADLSNGAQPMDSSTEVQLMKSIISELNTKFPVYLDPIPSCCRDAAPAMEPAAAPSHIVLVGASHALRLETSLNALGITTTVISTPSWRPTVTAVEKACTELTAALADLHGEVLIVFQMLDCAAYYARTEEGGLLPSRQAQGGKYHIDGELVVAPKELFLPYLKNCLPVLRAGGTVRKLLLTPLPRYWLGGCCEDVDHIPNRMEESYEDELFTGVDKLRRFTKDFVHMNKLTSVTVLNTVQMMGELKGGRSTSSEMREEVAEKWGPDPVHPAQPCYDALAKSILALIDSWSSEGQPMPKKSKWAAAASADNRVKPSPGHQAAIRGRGRRGRGTGGPYWRGGRGRF